MTRSTIPSFDCPVVAVMPSSLFSLWLFVLFTCQAGVSNLAATGAIGIIGRHYSKVHISSM